MRTTLNIEDDVLRAARSMADEQKRSLGTIVSELLRKALAPAAPTRYPGGFPVFHVSEAATPITPEMVQRALDEE